jgi:steroid delta-isomerase-like uncharacterized protein
MACRERVMCRKGVAMVGFHESSRSLLSRRAAVVGLGVAFVSRGVVAAQEATPAALPSPLSEWIAGWQALDPDRVAAMYAEDAIHEVVATGETFSGREAVRANIAALMTAVPDAALTVNQAFATGEVGAIDWTFTGHYSGQLPGFPPPAGQELAFRAATLFELEDGLVVRTTEFYDLYGLFIQLGLPPPSGGEMAATPERA